ncbi:MAG: hypothetical protein GY928_34220 [Colwellia sp.]|nr:hypothetical protein [Colwellia sp.]
MAKKVDVTYLGIPHYYAACNECDWTYEDSGKKNRRKGQREIRKHVTETGHTVQLEKGVHVHYSLAKEKE